MTKILRDIRRHEAKMIAEELFALIRGECASAVKEITETEHESYLSVPEACALLNCSPWTLYKKKDAAIGTYTKIGNKLRFRKSALLKAMREGKFKGES